MLRPFIKLNRLVLQSKNKIGVFLLNENIPTEHALPILRRCFRGTWYYIFNRMFRIRDEIIRFTLNDIRWVKKLKFNIVNITTFKRQKNAIFDITPIFRTLRLKVPPKHPLYLKMFNYFKIFNERNNLLLYVVDLHGDSIRYNKSILYQILYFAEKYKDTDLIKILPKNIVISVLSGNKTFFIPIIVDQDYSNIQRGISFLKRILNMIETKTGKKESDSEIEQDVNTDNYIRKNLTVNPKPVSKAIKSLMPDVIEKQKSEFNGKINVPALVFNLGNNIIPNSVDNKFAQTPSNKIRRAVSNIIPADDIKGNNASPVSNVMNNNVLPVSPNDSILKYNKIEYAAITNTLVSILNTYKNSDLKISVKNYTIEDVPHNPNEAAPSDLFRLKIELVDKFNKVHKISILLPKLGNDGTYLVYGNKYNVVKQLFPIPITFPKKGVGKYLSYTITFLLEKTRYFSVIYISGCKIPIGVLLSYYFGFNETMSKYNIKYKIKDESTKDDDYKVYKLNNGKFIWFENFESLSPVQQDIIESLFRFKNIDKIQQEPLTKDYFKDFLVLYTGSENIHERLTYLLNISVDERTLQILKEKGLPTTLFDIILFMHNKVLEGYVTDRNSLQEVRVRGHEVIAHIAFDVIRKEISQYYYQVKRNNKTAKITINPNKVLSEIITSSSFQLSEYVNPIEQLMEQYKLTYAGYAGIPKDSVSDSLRAIHPTFYGTIDPIDGPVGGSVGTVQYFTMNQILTHNGSIIPKNFTDLYKNNILSFSTASIPFISKNEPTRAMMASNQSKQSVILKDPEFPLVQTGVESIIPSILNSDTFFDKSPCDGIVTSITDEKIVIRNKDNKSECEISLETKIARSGQGYSSAIHKKPIVKVGQKVKTGSIVTESNAIKNGIISYGKNLVTAYAFWKGYNFEDGVVVSEKVVNKLTSTHIITLSTFVDEHDRIVFISDKIKKGSSIQSGDDLVKISGTKFLDLIDSEVIDPENLIIFGDKYKLVAPYDGVIVDYKFYINGIDNVNYSPDVLQKLKELNVIKNDEPYFYKGQKFKGALIKIFLEVVKPLELGDKLTNRHASKGVVCLISPEKDMPKLPDGRTVEIIINPLSFINRTNVGQLYELYTGEIAYQFGKLMLKLPRSQFLKILGKCMINLDKKFYGSSIFNFLSRCDDLQYKQFMKVVKENNGFPILVPPFSEPNYKQIKHVMKLLKIPPKYNVTMPDGSKKLMPVGMQYILKLEHMSSHKVFSRSLGPYQRKTGQPTQGKARGGGQRLSEGDVWSLAAWNAENILKEFLSGGSDDFRLKQQMYREILNNGSVSLSTLQEGSQQSKKTVTNLFKGIMLQV